ncbi:sensor histidine kinase [Desulfosarcina sp.]|uniref:sensor histidine kinase n=1 Tax=Desulfosarcina sp. TaxID=2027861 RepID=UPI003970AEC2
MIDDPAYDRLRQKARHLSEGETCTLTAKEQADLLRMVHDLEISRAELFDLYESAPIAYATLNPKGIILRANAMARNLLNIDQRSDTGRGFSSFVIPEDWGSYFRRIRNLSEEKTSDFFDLRIVGPARRPITVHVQAAAQFDRQGNLTACQLTFFDVSDRRRQERQLRRLNEQLDMASKAADLGIWNFDPVNRKVIWNDRLYRLLGLEPGDGLEDGERFFGFIHPEDRRGIIKGMDALLKSDRDDIMEDFRIIRADGVIRWMASRGRIYRDVEGQPIHISGINYDITERKHIEAHQSLVQRQLATQLKETQRLNEELSQYAYVVSHDLKEPLRAIRNYVDFLSEDLAAGLSGPQKQYLDGLKSAADHGNTLIGDLLAFSRLERAVCKKEHLDLADLMVQIRTFLQPGSEAEITIEAAWPPIVADRTLLWQILQNLLSNAIKFNDHTPKRVEIGWRAAPDDRIDIYVRDNGIGIDPQYQDKIFGIFQRLHTQRQFDGTGIGLAIVRKAAHLIDGTVRLESEPGKGSIFTLNLPRK